MRMKFEILAQARKRYLDAKPVRINTIQSVNSESTMTVPVIGDVQIVGAKMGMEYLAICHDEEAVEEWISDALGIMKDPELAGVLFANVFRGVNVVVGEIIHNAGLRTKMHQLAIEAWQKDFDEDFGGSQ